MGDEGSFARLSGAVAIVTGGGRSIGRAIAVALGEGGADVVVAGRDAVSLERVVKEVRGVGVRSIAVQCDVRSREDMERLVSETAGALGSVDIMVANAGVFQRNASAEECSISEWEDSYATNLHGVMLSCVVAGRAMLAARGGSIVIVSSVQGLTSLKQQMCYTTMKHGVVGMTKALAVDWAQRGIRVNAVAPGFIVRDDEPLLENPTAVRMIEERTPMGRFGYPREVGLAVRFLASPAASYITGAVLPVDGGWLAE